MNKSTKRALSLLALSAITTTASAIDWWAGVSAGYGYNTLSNDQTYAYDVRYKGRGSFTVAIPVQADFTDWFALRADVQYVQKNYTLKHRMYLTDFDYKNHYVQIPLMAHFSFGGDQLRGYVNAGGFGGYWLRQQAKGTINMVDVDDKLEFYDDDKRLQFGLVGGAGIEYTIDNTYCIFAEGHYYYSTTSKTKVYDHGSHPHYNNTFTAQIGVRFCLGNIF